MISQLNTTIKTLNETIARQQSENDNLKAELAWFRQKLFGLLSERRVDNIEGQLSLFENLPEDEKPVEIIGPEIMELHKLHQSGGFSNCVIGCLAIIEIPALTGDTGIHLSLWLHQHFVAMRRLLYSIAYT